MQNTNITSAFDLHERRTNLASFPYVRASTHTSVLSLGN